MNITIFILIFEFIIGDIIILKYLNNQNIDPVRELIKLYNFISIYLTTGSAPYSSLKIDNDLTREIIKETKDYISFDVGRKIKIPLLKSQDITNIKIEDTIDKIITLFEIYNEKIETYSMFIVASLLFPPIMLLSISIFFGEWILTTSIPIQIIFIAIVLRRLSWKKKL